MQKLNTNHFQVAPTLRRPLEKQRCRKRKKKLRIFSYFPEFSTIFLLSRLRTGNNLRLYDFVFTTNYFISIEGDNSWKCVLDGAWPPRVCVGCIPRDSDCKGFLISSLLSILYSTGLSIFSFVVWWHIPNFWWQNHTSTCSVAYWVLNLLQVNYVSCKI